MKSFHILYLFTLLSTSSSSISSRIHSGREINIEEIPYQVAIIQRPILQSPTIWCGGSLISKHFVLSAAHCFDEYLNANFSVKIGTSYLDDEEALTLDVSKIYNHQKFNKITVDYDFALLQLLDIVEFPRFVVFAKLPTIHDKLFVEDKLFTSGWGLTENRSSSNVLLGGTIRSYSFEKCNRIYDGKLTDRMICAGYEDDKTSTCTGDSGGPLVRESDGLLFGVTSFGIGCGVSSHPGVYAKVNSVLGWIYEIMNYSSIV